MTMKTTEVLRRYGVLTLAKTTDEEQFLTDCFERMTAEEMATALERFRTAKYLARWRGQPREIQAGKCIDLEPTTEPGPADIAAAMEYPPQLTPFQWRIVCMRAEGRTFQEIADELNASRVGIQRIFKKALDALKI